MASAFLIVSGHLMNNPHDLIDDRSDVVTRGLMGPSRSCLTRRSLSQIKQ
jgi:hypothetical protein